MKLDQLKLEITYKYTFDICDVLISNDGKRIENPKAYLVMINDEVWNIDYSFEEKSLPLESRLILASAIVLQLEKIRSK